MDEFIIWDNIFKVFLNPDNIFMDSRGNMYNIEDGDIDELSNSEHSLHKNICLKDVNGKNIYADSSIVEMYRGLDSFIGYYSYNKNKAHYEFIILDGCDNDSFGNIVGSSLKIIDTIQENKLGLIKA